MQKVENCEHYDHSQKFLQRLSPEQCIKEIEAISVPRPSVKLRRVPNFIIAVNASSVQESLLGLNTKSKFSVVYLWGTLYSFLLLILRKNNKNDVNQNLLGNPMVVFTARYKSSNLHILAKITLGTLRAGQLRRNSCNKHASHGSSGGDLLQRKHIKAPKKILKKTFMKGDLKVCKYQSLMSNKNVH